MRRSILFAILTIALILSSGVPAGKQGPRAPESPRAISLTLEPSRLDTGQESLALLPKSEELKDGDGAAFYGKAAQSLPAKLDPKQLSDWTKMPLRDLPQAKVQAVLEQAKASLELIEQGAKCKGCTWPPFVAGSLPANLTEYRQLTYLLSIKARLEIAQGQYDRAIETMRTGLAMSKHLGECPTTAQGMVGVAIAGLLLQRGEDLAQVKGSPNLYRALAALPRPVVDLNVPMSSELKSFDANKQKYPLLARGTLRNQLQGSFEMVRVIMHRLDAHVAALQCLEALRHYAATHQGQLPRQLSEITDLQIPVDPASGKPFIYRYDGSKAILEVSVPKGGSPRDGIRYEITVAR